MRGWRGICRGEGVYYKSHSLKENLLLSEPTVPPSLPHIHGMFFSLILYNLYTYCIILYIEIITDCQLLYSCCSNSFLCD